jgi:hypothetical protein
MPTDIAIARTERTDRARIKADEDLLGALRSGHAGGGIASLTWFLELEHAVDCSCGATCWADCTDTERARTVIAGG